ncbi:MAG: penicillin-binding protein 2 [Candidatus Staskawiczbacteria bacterium RIFCSPLOWO2_01_FULL_38_12b]|uniref:Penicillin-binding protein 2 n=1 Tax=Candidatus Staskawiczbacteria bacterium RIFCSPLOWO2_01_FULL_38_12b TaxID=1802214 RepID=A0A1G2IHZ9_9BACT|nr:MAG: penicillin-binding protein 2 [Candidatus Staskawiczbacteria bacterium RIFCSPLOWO2_01_FULL_38_12b]
MNFKKNYKVKPGYQDIETNEIFLDTLASVKEAELGLSEKKFEVPVSRNMIFALFFLFFFFTFILFSKTFYLQIVNGKQLYLASENNKGRISLINSERGIIYDSNGKKLVINSPDFNLVCDKRNFSLSKAQSVKEVSQIAAILAKSESEIIEAFKVSEETQVLLAENIPQEILLVLEAKMGDLPDCHIEKNTLRNYVMGPVFSHVLGYTGKPSREDLQTTASYTVTDNVGKTGLEKSYESYLRGTPGKVKVIKNAVGNDQGDTILSLPEPGYNLVLHIDAHLQQKTYEALEKSIKNIGSKKGAVVVLNPQNGAILAMVSYPAYDNNIFSGGISQADFDKFFKDQNQPFFNRAISAQYPTGSTIKPFEATGVLQENLISPTKLINDPGYILVKSKYDPSIVYTFAGVVPHGLVDMRKAIAVSSNIYFYTVGGGYGDQKGLGPSGIKKYLDLYGWEDKTGIDLPGEFKGFVPTPAWKKETKNESWWDGDTYNLAIGQSDLQVTPLQVAAAYSYIANGGTLYKPQIVQKVIDGSGENASIIKEFKPEIIRQNFIDTDNLQVVREGMLDGVRKSYGSSYMLNDIGVPVAGKTGTAEIGREGVFNTWSSAFAPYDNPEIVVVSTIEEVAGLRAATLPVTHDILQYYFSVKK